MLRSDITKLIIIVLCTRVILSESSETFKSYDPVSEKREKDLERSIISVI